MLIIVISWMIEIMSEINSSLHMSISNLNIQKVIFIVYCFMKIYVPSLNSFPQAKHFAKTLWSWDSFPFHHNSLQIAESLEIPDWK